VAQEYCRGPADCTGDAAEEIYVSYSGRPPEELKMLDYFVCGAGETLTLSTDKAADFKARIGGKALLIGGTFRPPGPADFHETPRHQLAGVVINAYAVRAEIEGSGLHDIRQPQAWVLDFAIGVVIVLIFHHPLFEFVTSGKGLLRLREFEVRCKIIASFALLLGFYALIRWGWPGVPYLTGFTGVGLGVLIHQISEMFLENPKYREKASTRE
jgi:CHASE2 domain-containing sensor protein